MGRSLTLKGLFLLSFLIYGTSSEDTDTDEDRAAVDGSHPIGMVDEVTFKVIPGYAAKGRRFSHIAFKEVKIRLIQ